MTSIRIECAYFCLFLFTSACGGSAAGPYPVSQPAPTARPATQAAIEPTPGFIASIEAAFEGIRFSIDPTLAQAGLAQTIPQYLEPSGFIFYDMPEHVRFDFVEPYTSRSPFLEFQPAWNVWLSHQNVDVPDLKPQIFVYPVGAFQAISPGAGERIEALRSLLDGRALPAGAELPVLPMFNSAQDLRVQVKTIEFQNGRGIRFVGRYSQEATPVINPTVFYSFQGLTEDGESYIAAFFPLYVPILPDEIEVPDWEAFNQQYREYMEELSSSLESLTPGDFEPDLNRLDALIRSVEVHPNALWPPYPQPGSVLTYP